MARRNANKKKNELTRRGNATAPKRQRRQQEGVLNTPIRTLSFSPSNPGRALVRGSIELRNGSGVFGFGYTSFGDWCGQARSLLGPFSYFRVERATVKVCVAGGTASAHSVAFNISNSYRGDSNTVAVLNDDYAALATAASMPTIVAPASYWAGRSRMWFAAVDPVAGVPAENDLVAGVVSCYGSGGADGTVVVGWAIIEMDLTFHTLT